MENRSLIISNKSEELERLRIFIEELGRDWSLQASLVFELNLILEEYIMNLVNYGYHDTDKHEISIEMIKEEAQLKIIVIDDAGPFNIMETPENKEIDKPVEERRIGGLGIHFIKSLTDHLEYVSDGVTNRLVIAKKLKGIY